MPATPWTRSNPRGKPSRSCEVWLRCFCNVLIAHLCTPLALPSNELRGVDPELHSSTIKLSLAAGACIVPRLWLHEAALRQTVAEEATDRRLAPIRSIGSAAHHTKSPEHTPECEEWRCALAPKARAHQSSEGPAFPSFPPRLRRGGPANGDRGEGPAARGPVLRNTPQLLRSLSHSMARFAAHFEAEGLSPCGLWLCPPFNSPFCAGASPAFQRVCQFHSPL